MVLTDEENVADIVVLADDVLLLDSVLDTLEVTDDVWEVISQFRKVPFACCTIALFNVAAVASHFSLTGGKPNI